jgi:hypothetical protein
MAVRSRFHFEPWRAERSTTWEAGFAYGPPADPVLRDDWLSAQGRAEKNADWLVWAAGMTTPTVCDNLSGTVSFDAGEGIIARISVVHSDHPAAPDQEQVARRIAECVNALAGVHDPVAALAAAREVLGLLYHGRLDPADARVLAAWVRLLPAADFETIRDRPLS